MRKMYLSIILAAIVGNVLLTAKIASAEEHPSTTPEDLIGHWMYGTISALQYWEEGTNKYLGNARSMADYYVFNDGTYKEYVYIQMRTYGLVTTVWTTNEGLVDFDDDRVTFTPTKGHYKSESGSRNIDRDMTDEELADRKRTYRWQRGEASDGTPLFQIVFDDATTMDCKRHEPAASAE